MGRDTIEVKMAWSSGFKINLDRSEMTPRYKLKFHKTPRGPGGFFTISGGLDPSQTTNQHKPAYISAEGPRISGTKITPVTWGVSMGGFEVPIVGDISQYYPNLMRGVFAGLYMILGDEEERIAFGQLKEINGKNGKWSFVFQDLLSSLQGTTSGKCNSDGFDITGGGNSVKYGQFFRTIGMTATASAYTLGGNTITINKCQFFKKQYAENGLCKIEMKDAGGASLGTAHFEWSAISATTGSGDLTLTAASKGGSVIYPGDAPLQSFHSGTVTSLAFIHGHPWDLLTYMILSRDNSGSLNTNRFPQSWASEGNFPYDLVDVNDMNIHSAYFHTPPGGTGTNYKFSIPLESSLSAGLRGYSDLVKPLGMWPVWRQDSVSWRGCQDIYNASIHCVTISETDIIEITRHSLFSAQNPLIYAGVFILYPIDSTTNGNNGSIKVTNDMPSLPFESVYNADGSRLYDVTLNASQMATNDSKRLLPWARNVTETIDLRLTPKYAKLCAGDLVEITTRFLQSPIKGDGNFERQRAMVTSVSWEVSRGYCSIQVALYRDNFTYY
tara:strand:+ start:19030 stop:20694 length:1665 start_codon:yes stop_codon:yes gene_type:complete